MEEKFKSKYLENLYKPALDSSGEDNGQLTIIGGSSLFHGAPMLALKVASRIVDMVFFATPEKSVGYIAENAKSTLMSFIWVPWEEVEDYIKKSDCVLIGPGFMRYSSEKVPEGKRNYKGDEEAKKTREITKKLLTKYKDKKWVIDAGSLQVMDPKWIPKGAILTPNEKEYESLFGKSDINEVAKKYKCIIVKKGPKTITCSNEGCFKVEGGNPGMTKGGTGDVLAGLTAALYTKNDSLLAASSASLIAKSSADELFKRVGVNYNAEDLAEIIPEVMHRLIR